MVETYINDRQQGHIVISPNLSAEWKTTRRFIIVVSAAALVIGIGFAFAGLWLILPFAGLEVIAVVSLMYYVAHQCHRQQVIHLNDTHIRVERGYRFPQQVWESELFWTRLLVLHSDHTWHSDRLLLRSSYEQMEIGEFLNEEDKRKHVANLRGLLSVVD